MLFNAPFMRDGTVVTYLIYAGYIIGAKKSMTD